METVLHALHTRSRFLQWLAKTKYPAIALGARVHHALARAPGAYASFDVAEFRALPLGYNWDVPGAHELPGRLLGRLMDFTAFALTEFRSRAQRDGVRLVLLAADNLGSNGAPHLDRLQALAAAAGIDVVDFADHVHSQGGAVADTRFPHDWHWNAQGHMWAAEAIFAYLQRNSDICGS